MRPGGRNRVTGIAPGRETEVRCRSHVLFRDLGGEAVLLDRQKGTYFGLNEVGTVIWDLAKDGARLGSIHDALSERFAEDPERIWNDLVGIVSDMESHGLLEVTSA